MLEWPQSYQWKMFEARKPSASYLHWVPCGWSSSSADTASPFSCPSYTGSQTKHYPTVLPRQPGSLCCYPAWLPSPCPQGTGASPGTESCSEGSGCTCHSPGCSPPIRVGPLSQIRLLEFLRPRCPRTLTKSTGHPRNVPSHLVGDKKICLELKDRWASETENLWGIFIFKSVRVCVGKITFHFYLIHVPINKSDDIWHVHASSLWPILIWHLCFLSFLFMSSNLLVYFTCTYLSATKALSKLNWSMILKSYLRLSHCRVSNQPLSMEHLINNYT